MILTDAHCGQCAVKDESRHVRVPGVATGRLELPRQVTRRLGLVRTPKSAEDAEPVGQALGWYEDVLQYVPRARQGTAHEVAHQIARLCGDDSQVVMPWRSLADAVSGVDRAGRTRAFTERGVQALVEAGWLEVETTGQKRGARTTWRLTVGPQRTLKVAA